ncbi:type II toxin-antitoxin system VapC family toxin [Candidatus Woesearchaeota archaeon]|nr:type II toxin-antitoxin system VapC family toxin [Candidatus Woesearchaeota archaeon]
METKEELNKYYVLDSSVVIKWFSNEEHTDIALKLRDMFVMGDIEIVVPDLQIYEIANALRYNKQIERTDVDNAVKSLIEIGIKVISPKREIMKKAIDFSYDYDLTIYDSCFIALAKELNFVFVTADEKLYKKIKSLNFVKLLKDV